MTGADVIRPIEAPVPSARDRLRAVYRESAASVVMVSVATGWCYPPPARGVSRTDGIRGDGTAGGIGAIIL
jgi:hypothetical protein